MRLRIPQALFFVVLTITLFSLWAGFALLVVNRFFYEELPGYTIGRLCILEVFALAISAIIASLMIRNWGTVSLQRIEGKSQVVMNSKYAIFFTFYFFTGVGLAIWQFWLFSLAF